MAGIDEVGRGPWAGPVVAAAVIFDPRNIPDGIDDSKRVRPARRVELAARIHATAAVGIGWASVAEIEELNILGASDLAMARAVAALPEAPAALLVDGTRVPAALTAPGEALKGGDGRALSVAAASIVAKVARDAWMSELATGFPGYGWDRNMGYGTREHRAALERLGCTPHHRRKFRPVAEILV
ncbi:MAG: ribonuclease HII [Paracoccaceae bacterium]